MLKEHATVFRRLMIFVDLCLVFVSFFVAYYLWDNAYVLYPLSRYKFLIPINLVIWGVLLYRFRIYESFRVRKTIDIISSIWIVALLGFFIFGSVLYMFKIEEISRGFLSLSFLTGAAVLTIEKLLVVIAFRYARSRGYNYRGILIVGTNQRACKFIQIIHDHAEWGFKVIGLIDADPKLKGEWVEGCQVIGTFEDVPEIVHNNVVDEVVFVVPRSWINHLEAVMHFCESQGVKVHLALDIFNPKLARVKQAAFEEFPLLTYESTPDKVWHLVAKRLSDIMISLISLTLLSPLFLLIAVLIKMGSKGPVFYSQIRSGLNGRKFYLYKFRTMNQDAEDQLKDLLKHNEMDGPVFKMKDDPRLTRIGKFLRETSLDELPQLWNVLRGDMSLVGPRPPLPQEVSKYETWQRRKLSMRPGITCTWQASGRNNITDFNQWMKLDLHYIDNWSLWLDLKIMLKTVPAVLLKTGAK